MNNIDFGIFTKSLKEKLASTYPNSDIVEFLYNQHVYSYGNQLKVNEENLLSSVKANVYNYLRELYCYYMMLKYNQKVCKDKKCILSSAYFGVNEYLRHNDYHVVEGPWRVNGAQDFIRDYSFVHSYYTFMRRMNSLKFQDLISDAGQNSIKLMLEETVNTFKRRQIDAIIANSTHTVNNRLPLKAAKFISIPSFVFLHGLPSSDYDEEEDKSDYLIVWSDKIKENQVKYSNYPASRIYVSGHPSFTTNDITIKDFTLDDILIISPSTSDSWNIDRGNMLYYLFSIEEVLRDFGVKSVRFRPHPHEDPKWYLKFINNEFFKIDSRPINQALNDSTLLIGTTSTVLLESIYKGINYLVYMPYDSKGNNIYGRKDLAPFDGSDPYLPIARSQDDLRYMLKNHTLLEPEFFKEYIQTPFDMSFIKKLI